MNPLTHLIGRNSNNPSQISCAWSIVFCVLHWVPNFSTCKVSWLRLTRCKGYLFLIKSFLQLEGSLILIILCNFFANTKASQLLSEVRNMLASLNLRKSPPICTRTL